MDDLLPEVINLEGKTCSRLSEKYPKNVKDATGGFINGQVIICGGEDRDTDEYYNECYTLKKGGTWTLLGNLSETRWYSSSVVIGNSLYIIGGRGGSSLYPTRPAQLDSTTKSGPGSTRPAREAKMLRLDRLEASLF